MDSEELIQALLAADALRFGEFELAHGGTSDYYIDKYRFETDPQALERVATAFGERLSTLDEIGTTIAGVALGAVPLAAATSIVTETPYVVVRKEKKEYGTGNRVEGDLEVGERVVLLEDITTTGKSALEAVSALRSAGATVERVLVVVDRDDGARERLSAAGVELDPLLTAEDLLAESE